MILETERADLRRRPWQSADKPSLPALASNRKIWRNLTDRVLYALLLQAAAYPA
jgi:hypothetical protein